MIPKWQNITAEDYERKEMAAFIAFVKRQKQKIFLLKKLVRNKYANTLTVASSHKNSRFETHILDAVQQVCSENSSVLAAVKHFTEKSNRGSERRQKLLIKVTSDYERDETAKNLNLGPVKHELRTINSSCGHAKQAFSELSYSARPVAPFPFQNEDLLDDNQKYRLTDVWTSSRAIKKSRLERENEVSENALSLLCCFCKIVIEDEKVECSICSISAHSKCLENYNSEWEICDEGHSICKQCCSFDRLAQL